MPASASQPAPLLLVAPLRLLVVAWHDLWAPPYSFVPLSLCFLSPSPPRVSPHRCHHCCCPLSVARCHRHSPPSPMQQCLIIVSLLSVVHHIFFIFAVMLHVVIIASFSCPPLLLAGLHCPLPDAVWFLFVRCSHCHRSVVGKQTNNCPCPQAPTRLWVDVGRRGARTKVSHALFDCCHRGCPSSVVPIVSIRHQSSTVHHRVVSPSATSPPQHCCHLRLKRLIVVYID